MTSSQGWVWDIFLFLIRVFKVPVRWLTSTHEIERIIGKSFTPSMTSNLEEYIYRSKQLSSIQKSIKSPNMNIISIMNDIIKIKNLSHLKTNENSNYYRDYIETNLKHCLRIIKYYNQVKLNLNESIISFDLTNTDHENKLKQLWFLMKPLEYYQSLVNPTQQLLFEIPQTTVTHDDDSKNDDDAWYPGNNHIGWELLGFQSERPDTDFRGMGIFSLKQMIWFGKYYHKQSSDILKYCMQYGQLKVFSFAITGIAVSNDCLHWFNNDSAKQFIYLNYAPKHILTTNETQQQQQNKTDDDDVNGAVNELYCQSFIEFHRFWSLENPVNIMEYSIVHAKFLKLMKTKLELGLLSN